MLRVRLDGLPPHKFVEQRQETRTQAATFLLSADAAATQQMFLEKFGGGSNACKSDLPRRSSTLQETEPQTAADVQVQVGKETKASLKRKRALQVAGLNSATEVCEDTQDLEAVAQNSATLRQEESPGFEKLKNALKRNATILRNRFLNMISGDTKKYDEAVRDAARLEARLLQALRASGPLPTDWHPSLSVAKTLVIHPVGCNTAAVQARGLRCMPWTGSVPDFQELLRYAPEDLLWFHPDAESEVQFIMNGAGADQGSLVASRAVGGWVAGAQWLATCDAHGRAVRPLLRLASALEEAKESLTCNSVLCFISGSFSVLCVCAHFCDTAHVLRALSIYIEKGAGKSGNAVATAVARLMSVVSESEKPKNWALHRKWKSVKAKTTLVIAEDVPKCKKHQIKKGLRGQVMSGSSFVSVCTYWEK